jgi:hypothetical protein
LFFAFAWYVSRPLPLSWFREKMSGFDVSGAYSQRLSLPAFRFSYRPAMNRLFSCDRHDA